VQYEITFGDAKPLKFAKAETLLQWIEGELSSWSWLQSGNQAVWNEFNQQLVNIRNHANTAVENPEHEQFSNDLQVAINSLQALMRAKERVPRV